VIDYDPFSDRVFDDPLPIYKQLRDEAPVYYIEEFDCWFLSRFEDIWQALESQNEFFTSAGGTTSIDLMLGQRSSANRDGTSLSTMDEPQHTQLRTSIMKFFFPGAARRMEGLSRELVRGFLDEIYERGECDAIHDIAMRLSVRIACTIIGIPLEDADLLCGQVNLFFQREEGKRGQTEVGQNATNQLADYLEKWLDEQQKTGGTSALMQALFDAEVDGRKISRDDQLATLNLLVVGGTETLPKVFAGAVYRLWQNPDQRAEVAENPELAKDAFWEALRYDMPTNMLGRTVAKPFPIHGETLDVGQKLMFLWHCANHDEREFPDPDRYDIHRGAERILSLGHGSHRCLGAHIAQMEGRVLVQELLARIPDYEVIEDRQVRLRSEFFQGWGALPIRWRVR
jgi:cytochrome P450